MSLFVSLLKNDVSLITNCFEITLCHFIFESYSFVRQFYNICCVNKCHFLWERDLRFLCIINKITNSEGSEYSKWKIVIERITNHSIGMRRQELQRATCNSKFKVDIANIKSIFLNQLPITKRKRSTCNTIHAEYY